MPTRKTSFYIMDHAHVLQYQPIKPKVAESHDSRDVATSRPHWKRRFESIRRLVDSESLHARGQGRWTEPQQPAAPLEPAMRHPHFSKAFTMFSLSSRSRSASLSISAGSATPPPAPDKSRPAPGQFRRILRDKRRIDSQRAGEVLDQRAEKILPGKRGCSVKDASQRRIFGERLAAPTG